MNTIESQATEELKRTKSIVNRDFPKFVLEDADLPLTLLLENIVHEGGLACSEKAGNHCDRGQIPLVRCCFRHGRSWRCFVSVSL